MSEPSLGETKRTSRMATAALVCGILFIIAPLALLAVVFGIAGVRKTRVRGIGGKEAAIAGIVLGCLGLALTPWEISAFKRANETANRAWCSNYMRQIGLALTLYAGDHNHLYPPDLGTLLKTEDITADAFVCPSSGTVLPRNLTTEQGVEWVNANSDYIYLGAGLDSDVYADTIVVYEKDNDHRGEAMNVLFADNHVEFLSLPEAHQAIEASKKAWANEAHHGQPTIDATPTQPVK